MNTKAEAARQIEMLSVLAAQLREIPALHADCRKAERSGVVKGDRLDAALVKTDGALGRANQRVARCAGLYDALKVSREGQK